ELAVLHAVRTEVRQRRNAAARPDARVPRGAAARPGADRLAVAGDPRGRARRRPVDGEQLLSPHARHDGAGPGGAAAQAGRPRSDWEATLDAAHRRAAVGSAA